MRERIEAIKKVCMLGDPAVGKTSLVRRYVFNEFDQKYAVTTGMQVSRKEMDLTIEGVDINLTLMIHDIIGQPGHRDMHTMYFKGVEGVLACCDVTRRSTLDSLAGWLDIVASVRPDAPVVYAANKSDLAGESEFSLSDLEECRPGGEGCHFLTSAKTGDGVDHTFAGLGRLVVRDIISSIPHRRQ